MHKSLLVTMLLGVLSCPCLAAAKPAVHALTYDVYAGGIHAMQANLNIEQKQTNYKLSLSAETYGLLKKLANWSGVFGSEGVRVSRAHHKPKLHYSEAAWKNEVERKDYKYSKTGDLIGYKVIEAGKKNKKKSELDPALFKNTTDILSATMDVMDDLSTKESCTKTRTIFDGDRSFDIIFKDDGTETLESTKYNIYKGETIKCTIEVNPKLGKWHEKPRGWISVQEQGRKSGTMPTIWFAKLSDDPNAPYMPVKVRVKIDYGTLFMHLTSYKDNSGITKTADIKLEK